MRLLIAILWTLSACSDPPARPQSVPVPASGGIDAGGQVDLAVDLEGPKPISRTRLKELWPKLTELNDTQLMGFSNAVNSVPAPCEPCGTLPIAHCVDRDGTTPCPIITKLVNRSTRLALENRNKKEIKASINYPDLWFPMKEESESVVVVLYRDQEGPFAAHAAAVLDKLKAEFSDKVDFVIYEGNVEPEAALGVRSRPTWFINGHRFRGAQSVKTLARFIRFEVLDPPQ